MTLLIALAAAAPAAAAPPCDHPASAYSTGGSPGSGAANDPLFGEQWGLEQIKSPAAWARSTGTDAVVAVVDTGVDFSHPDLQGKLLAGADFVEGEDAGECEGAQDENGHGTHVAGIVAAVTNNGIGVAGTAPGARILPVRVLDTEGSAEDEWILDGIRYAADQGADVINMSLGGPPVFGQMPSDEFEQAIDYAWEKGSVVVAAAGNETFPACSYPAAAENAVCVAATDQRGMPSYYSNFPADPDGTVGVRAPGGIGSFFCEDSEDIWSTIWPAAIDDCNDAGAQKGYETFPGTSMSAPHVAGLAAQLSSLGLNNAQIVECLRTKSSNEGSYDPVMGWGVVDADKATAECSAGSTPAFVAPAGSGSGGGSGGPSGGSGGQGNAGQRSTSIVVRIRRTSRRKLARTGRLRVRITSSDPTTVRLRAIIRRRAARGARTAGRKTVVLRKAGTRRAAIRLTRRARRMIRRGKARTLRVRWSGAGQRGFATRR